MKSCRLVAVLLVLCLMVSFLGVTAWAQEIPAIQSGGTVTFSTTKSNHVVYYSFTPQTSGTYVLYDLGDCAFQSWLSVHTCAPTDAAFDQQQVTKGLNQVIFQAEAGVTCWLKLDCAWVGGGELSHSFKLASVSAATDISIGHVSLASNEVGSEGRLYLKYEPMGSGEQVVWSTSDSRVAVVEGDANSAKFRLNGPGTATITASTASGLTAQYEVASQEVLDIAVGGTLNVTMPDAGGSYVTNEKIIRFTPETSGSYVLSVSYDEALDVWHGLEMTLNTDSGVLRGSNSLHIPAEAGKTYAVQVEFWGMYDQNVDYTFSLQPSVDSSGIQLVPKASMGYVGTSLSIGVQWIPANSLGEAITWSVSDQAVAKVASGDDSGAKLQLLAAGNVTVTATTASGLTASVEITALKHPGTIGLVQGENPPLQMLGSDYFKCSFTAPATGYYRFSVNSKSFKLQLEAPSVNRNGEKLYLLEEGKTYYGGIDNLSENIEACVVTIALVEVPKPTAVKITKLPDQTEFLPGVLAEIWVYDLLEGIEMDVTWSDGRTTHWAFNRDDLSHEGYEIRWELRTTGDFKRSLIMKLGDVSDACQLTVKNLNVVRMELLEGKTLQIVENSCGYYDEQVKSWIYSDYLLGTQKLLITFDDGSTVTARPGQTVYGKRLMCEQNQYESPWVKGGENPVVYTYGKLTIQVKVEIIDSPVRRIQFVTKPRSSFTIGDRKFFVSYGDGQYYFSPDSLKDYLDGLSFRIFYKDNTSKVVKAGDIEWIKVSGVKYPFVDGYPLGLLGELMMSYDPISGPCTSEGMVEYMGASLTYAIELVEKPEDIPGTQDTGLAIPAGVLLMALLAMAAVITCKKKMY